MNGVRPELLGKNLLRIANNQPTMVNFPQNLNNLFHRQMDQGLIYWPNQSWELR
jgi:hypothetical protein